MQAFSKIDGRALGELTAEAAVELFRALLWCSARRWSLPLGSISISSRVDVADGGVDAEIQRNNITPEQDLLVAGNSSFQIKTGHSAFPWRKEWLRKELFGSAAKPSKSALGESVRHCLSRKGRYIFVCFGSDPTGAQRRKAIQNLRTVLRSCGYANPCVDVWGQSTLEGMLDPFISLKLRLANQHDLPFRTLDDWRLDAEMQRPMQLGKTQQQVIDTIRECMRGRDITHVRLVGEPGLGKTRLALEAVSAEDLSAQVVYARSPEDFERSPLFNTILRADDSTSVLLVIDDCPAKDRASIWNALRSRSHRIRLITLDHGPELTNDELMRVIDCPPLQKGEIEAILAGYIERKHDVSRWAEFCSGSPRVAHAVGENLRNNPDDLLKPPASVPLWERYVHGSAREGTHDESQKEIVLRYVALFRKFGFESPVEPEGKFIAQLVEEADPTITWPKFQSIIKHFRDRRILQGKTTLFFVPWLLHIYLWVQFWEHHGRGVDVSVLLSRMPPDLFRWFTEMFKYGHASPSCIQEIAKLTSCGGPFDDPSFILRGPGAPFLNELAEADPNATLNCIERTIGDWSYEELSRFQDKRQYLVWALEKIAIWRVHFRRAAELLLKLALAENAQNSNNATGTFCGLFGTGRGVFASSEAPPEMRLPMLVAMLASSNAASRQLALRALKHALDRHPYSKGSGPEHQGMRPPPELWTPQVWSEVFDAYRKAWKVVSDFRRNARGNDRIEATEVMVGSMYWLVQNRWFEDEIIIALRDLIADDQFDGRSVVKLLASYRLIRWRGLSRKASRAMRAMEKEIEGDTVESKIRRYVLLGTWDDLGRSSKHHGEKHQRLLGELARDVLANPALFTSLVPIMFAQQGYGLFGFGFALGKEDSKFVWRSHLLDAFIAAGEKRVPDLLTGYMRAIFVRDIVRWELAAFEILNDSRLHKYVRPLVTATGLTEPILDAVCDAIKAGTVLSDTVRGLGYIRKRSTISIARWVKFLGWCIDCAKAEILAIGIETAYLIFIFDKEAPQVPEQPTLDLLTDTLVLRADTREPAYEWAELAKGYLKVYPQHSIRLFEAVLDAFDEWRVALGIGHSEVQNVLIEIITKERAATWAAIASRLLPLNTKLSSNILQWLGPSSHFGEGTASGILGRFEPEDVLKWVDEDPVERGRRIAAECPKTLDPADGGALTREMLRRYGHLIEVRGGLTMSFHTDGWSGSASEHFRKKRERFRAWLSVETAPQIADWLQEQIVLTDHDIAQHEIDEERRF